MAQQTPNITGSHPLIRVQGDGDRGVISQTNTPMNKLFRFMEHLISRRHQSDTIRNPSNLREKFLTEDFLRFFSPLKRRSDEAERTHIG